MPRLALRSILELPCFCAALILALTVSASAMTDSRSLTCQQVQAVVKKTGRAVISTGPSIYGEVVANSGACRVSMAQTKFAPTRDNPRCNIGFVCAPRTGGR
jgi:hypothetical protein